MIASAASIDFGTSLRDILKIDYFGPIKMLQFVKECKKNPVMNHVSTAYVNSNMKSGSYIEEKIYPWLGKDDFEV